MSTELFYYEYDAGRERYLVRHRKCPDDIALTWNREAAEMIVKALNDGDFPA